MRDTELVVHSSEKDWQHGGVSGLWRELTSAFLSFFLFFFFSSSLPFNSTSNGLREQAGAEKARTNSDEVYEVTMKTKDGGGERSPY